MIAPQAPEPYERDPSAVIVRLVVGLLIGGFVGWRLTWAFGLSSASGFLVALAGAVAVGYASVVYGDRFWKGFLRFYSGRWRE